jgi:hypothetical protein
MGIMHHRLHAIIFMIPAKKIVRDPPPRIVSKAQSDEEEYNRMKEMFDDVRHELLPVDYENPPQPPILRILLHMRL